MNFLSKSITKNRTFVFLSIGIVGLVLLSNVFYFRIDLTSDKRFSISPPSKKLMQHLNEPIQVTIYLDGDLNPGFNRLKKATTNLLEELSAYGKKFEISFVNPSEASNDNERNAKYSKLVAKGLVPTMVYERDKEGKANQKVVFPWIEIAQNGKRIPICLLKNIRGNSGEENLNV